MLADREEGIRAGTVLITAQELAQRIGYKRARGARTVREKVAAGLLPCVRLGRDLRFHWPTVIRALGVTSYNLLELAAPVLEIL